MNGLNTVQYDISGGSKRIDLITGQRFEPFACVQIVTPASYDGSTDEITLQESVDGANWNDILDNMGNSLKIVLAAPSTSYMLKTTIFLGVYVKANYVQVNGAEGILSISIALKGNF